MGLDPSLEQPSLIEQVDLGLGFRLGHPEVPIGQMGGLPASGGPDDQVPAEQVRLDLVLKVSTSMLIVAASASAPVGPPRKTLDQGLQVAAVLLVHALGVDVLHGQGVAGDGQVDVAVGAGGREVADPAEPGVGQAGGPSAPAGELPGGVGR